MNSPARILSLPLRDGSQLFDVDNFLGDLERLAAQAIPPAQFYPQLVEAAALALGAGESRWVLLAGGRLLVQHAHRRDGATPTPMDQPLQRELASVAQSKTPRVLAQRPDGRTILACPVHNAVETVGILTYALPADNGSANSARLLELAAAMAEIAGEYELRRQVMTFGDAATRLAQTETFLLRLHRTLKVQDATREIAEEGRRLVGCERLSVLIRSGKKWRVAAVSGVDKVAARAEVISKMEELTRLTAAQRETLVMRDQPLDLPPQVQTALDRYQEISLARQLVVWPCVLAEPEEAPLSDLPRVALVAEHFTGALPEDSLSTLRLLSDHAAIAIDKLYTLRSWSLSSLFSLKPSRVAAAVGIITACGLAAAALLLIPATLKVSVEGKFVPTERARVFAPSDSLVQELLVKHGDAVKLGQPLIKLRSPTLELDIQQVQGELATTRKEMSALETAKLRATLPGQKEETDVTALAAKLASLKELEASHRRRLALLQAEAKRLVVTSPMAGTVLSWNPQDYLGHRPVERGERLLEIAATGQAWNIELEVPDKRAGHVLAAQSANKALPVSYVLKSDPAETFAGKVVRIAQATQPDKDGAPVVRVVVEPNTPQMPDRSGMAVVAKLECGEHSLGYVWFHQAWEAWQRYWF